MGDQRGLAAGGRLEGEEADLVLGNVDGSPEADTRSLACQRFGRRAGSPLPRLAFAGGATREKCLNEVVRHGHTVGRRHGW